MKKLVAGVVIGVAVSGAVLYVRRARLERQREAAEVVAAPSETEAAYLHRTYGPTKYSQFYEEWIVRDFFHDKRGGTFVDVGAADFSAASNTYFLEKNLEWSGVAIDAQDTYRAGYEQHRPHTRFFNFFVNDHSNDKSTIYLSRVRPFVSSGNSSFTGGFAKDATPAEVTTVTLNDLLSRLKIETFDFLSLDIELYEPKALAGFDIERYRPRLACVEAHSQVRQQILDYFAAHHYTVVGKYLRVDTTNLWFMPAGTHVEPFPISASSTGN